MYIVVFEYTRTRGGFYGTRTYTLYQSQEEFRAMYSTNPDQIVLEEDVTEEHARKLVVAVPEVFRLTAAIEMAYADTEGNPSDELINHYLANTYQAIMADRQERTALDVTVVLPLDFSEHLEALQEEESHKAYDMSAAILFCDLATGKITLI